MKKLLIICVIIAVIVGGWFWLGIRPLDNTKTTPVLIKIESGQSLAAITSSLAEKHVIRSPLAFKLYARATGAGAKVRAGAYLLAPSESASEILTTLTTGKSQQLSVTIPEGFTVADIDALLASKGLGNAGDILDCAFHCDFSTFDFLPASAPGTRDLGYGSRLEGYLFPDTYFVDIADYNPKFFIERLLGTFRKRIVTAYATDIAKSGKTLAELTTMASLVEEESRKTSERPVVAGILWKRVNAGTVLGVDATIRYALGKQTEPLTNTDLQSDSAYNTRRKRGLPPTPIANAGESAFIAALRPETSSYWYYLHDTDGVIHYAVTNDEHNANRAKYLR